MRTMHFHPQSLLGAVLASLLTIGLLVPAEADALPTADADDLAWVPPAGHVAVTALVDLDWDLNSVQSQAASEPGRAENLRQVGVTCGDEPKEHSDDLNVRACWYLYKLEGEGDQQYNYFWEEFDVIATGHAERRISRVKGRNSSPDGENVRSVPASDKDYGAPETETYTLGFSVPTPQGGGVSGSLSRSTPIFPGRIHPYPERSFFHSSWITNNEDGAPPKRTIDSAGMNVWQVPESAGGIRTRNRWDVWCDICG